VHLTELIASGQAAWCAAVRLELWSGIRSDRERKTLNQFCSVVVDLPIAAAVWERAIALIETLHRRGQRLPYPDLLIYACKEVHGVELFHRDKHFDLLAKM
jgi:predicted nucleic acid-binding protein